MSLLLDALKKAALEKQQRDQQAQSASSNGAASPNNRATAEGVISESGLAEADPGVAPSAAAPVHAQDSHDELAFDGGSDLGEPLPDLPVLTLTDPAPEETQLTVPDQPSLSTLETLSLSPLELAGRPPSSDPIPPKPTPSIALTQNPKPDSNPVESSSGQPLQPTTAPSTTPATTEVESKDKPDPTAATDTAKPALNNTQSNERRPVTYQAAQGKAAMAQMLANSRSAAARANRQRRLLLAALVVTAASCMGAYYYFLVMAESSLTPLPPQRAQTLQPAVIDEPAVDENPESPVESAAIEAPVVIETPVVIEAPVVIEPPAAIEAPQVADQTAVLETTTAPKKTRVAETSAATEEPKIVVAAVTAHESTQNNQPVVQTAPPSKPDNAAPETYQARRIQIERQTPAVPPLQVAIEKGYQAWQQGDLDAARAAYEQALDLSPQHRDAVLGAAAVAVRQGRLDEALSFYQQRLNADPQDPHARAGLLSLLTTDSSDPALEAQLQSLLHRYPEAAHLHFLQGALFAGKSQWHAAQQAFFEAWRRERTHPDFAYNLAIALDHLGQTREALRFYQTALTLAAVKPAGFSVSLLQERVTTLEGVAP